MKNDRRKIILLLFLAVMLVFVDINTGSSKTGIKAIFSSIGGNIDEVDAIILSQIRIPRALTALLIGIALGLSGLIMQTVFENPLAGPYILGVSSGAGFGVAFMVLGAELIGITLSWAGYSAGALVGAAIVTVIILWLSYRYSSVIVLIAGVMLSGIFSALTAILQAISSPEKLKVFIMWTFGSTESSNYSEILLLASVTIVIFLLMLKNSRKLDLLYLGEEQAQATGLRVKQTKTLALAGISILTAAVTAISGPIAFVGIIAPHLSRATMNNKLHKVLMPATVLWAGIIMLTADILSHLSQTGLPLNAVLSLIGIPVLLYFILSGKSNIL